MSTDSTSTETQAQPLNGGRLVLALPEWGTTSERRYPRGWYVVVDMSETGASAHEFVTAYVGTLESPTWNLGGRPEGASVLAASFGNASGAIRLCSPHSLQHLLDLAFGLRELLSIAGA